MAISAALDSLLREHNFQYDLYELPANATLPLDAVSAVLLQSGEQRLHVLYPSHSLLDLTALRQQTGLPQLRAMPASTASALCLNRNFQQVPAVPGALGLPTLIDEQLLAGSAVALDSGENVLVRLPVEQFEQSFANARLGNFSVDIGALQHGKLDAVADVDEITHAVANFTQLRIKERLQETLDIPPLPATAQRVMQLRADPNADVRKLSALVETDPALAAQVVSWAGSPYYGYAGKLKSVQDAIVRVLGFEVVLNLALGMALGKTLSLPKDSPTGFTAYWQQALSCATAVESLVGCMPAKLRPTLGMAYLAGLLHNFGQLVLAEVFPPHYASYCRLQEVNPQLGYAVIERHLLGISRDQLASWLLRMWSMPEEVCTGVRFQNEAGYTGTDSAYANLIFIATRLLRRHGVGNAPLEPIPAELFERLHLDPEAAENAIAYVAEAGRELIEPN